MRLLFAINEALPLYKIGGLGDVGGSLPPALLNLGIDVRLALPLHPEMKLSHLHAIKLESVSTTYNRLPLTARVYLITLPGTKVPVYLFSEPRYLSQASTAADNYTDKYAVFSLLIATWLATTQLHWRPDVVHLHDWHTSLVPVILKHRYHDTHTRFLLTIHNLVYQGTTTAPVATRLELPPASCQILKWDQQDNDVNILMEGILHSDTITTVSPTYAQEVLTQKYGASLEPVLTQIQSRLHGILNGLDQTYFDPTTDPWLPKKYDHRTALEAKAVNRLELYSRLHRNPDSDHRLLGFIGRVDAQQKGIDLLVDLLSTPEFPPPKTHFIFLGTGDPLWESKLHQFDPHEHVTIITRFDEPLAHMLYAAADLLLIPSHYEPCGLIQLIAMRYGTLPVAHATGGLKDTITHNQTGFLYTPNVPKKLQAATLHALKTLANPTVNQRLIERAMAVDSSWTKAAKQYATLYKALSA